MDEVRKSKSIEELEKEIEALKSEIANLRADNSALIETIVKTSMKNVGVLRIQ